MCVCVCVTATETERVKEREMGKGTGSETEKQREKEERVRKRERERERERERAQDVVCTKLKDQPKHNVNVHFKCEYGVMCMCFYLASVNIFKEKQLPHLHSTHWTHLLITGALDRLCKGSCNILPSFSHEASIMSLA